MGAIDDNAMWLLRPRRLHPGLDMSGVSALVEGERMKEDVPPPGRVMLRITNMDTGHTETRILESDEYAILYGPDLELVEDYVMPILGTIRIRLRPKRGKLDA